MRCLPGRKRKYARHAWRGMASAGAWGALALCIAAMAGNDQAGSSLEPGDMAFRVARRCLANSRHPRGAARRLSCASARPASQCFTLHHCVHNIKLGRTALSTITAQDITLPTCTLTPSGGSICTRTTYLSYIDFRLSRWRRRNHNATRVSNACGNGLYLLRTP